MQFLGQLPREDLPALYARPTASSSRRGRSRGAWCSTRRPRQVSPWLRRKPQAVPYDLIEDGVNGYRVPVEDPVALAAALSRIAESRVALGGRRALARADGGLHR